MTSLMKQSTIEPLTFSIIVPTYNRSEMLGVLLKGLQAMRVPDRVTWEVIVVDNNSTDATRDVIDSFLRKAALPLRYYLERQQGAAHARNRGVQAARGKIIAFVDDDEMVVEDWLAVVHSAFQGYSCAAVGGRVLPRWISPPPDWYTTDGPYRIIGPIQDHDLGEAIIDYNVDLPMPLGGNFAVSRECFNKYGLFRTDLGPVGTSEYAMGEDTEFCLRLLHGGERLVYVPEAVTHNTVHPERLTKKFCQGFYFRLGRSLALLKAPKPGTHRIIGVPSHLFRGFAEIAAAWAGSLVRDSGSVQVYFRFQLAYVTGQIYQYLYMRFVHA
jgi:glycosyltransferase involved in cell wall biosynthesis